MLKKNACARMKCWLLVLLPAINVSVQAQTTDGTNRSAAKDSISMEERFSYHFQTTVIAQHQLDYTAPYSGTNSLLTSEPERLSLTSTLFLGARLWKGAEILLNPELSGGRGLSATRGVAGFPNGETYRIGDPEPVLSISRLFLRQAFNLSNDWQNTSGGQNILAGRAATSRIVITLGKFSVTDIFDANTYSHDPRNQFMNWAIMSAGAWDYPANTRGYTYGLAVELIKPKWSVKAGLTLVPETANGPFMDMNVDKAHSATLEINRLYHINKRKGVIRLIGYFTQGYLGSYAAAVADTPYHPHIEPTRSYAHAKGGFAINIEQELSNNMGLFARLSWNDGKNETWAFTGLSQ